MKQLNWQGKAGKGKDIYHLCFQGAQLDVLKVYTHL